MPEFTVSDIPKVRSTISGSCWVGVLMEKKPDAHFTISLTDWKIWVTSHEFEIDTVNHYPGNTDPGTEMGFLYKSDKAKNVRTNIKLIVNELYPFLK
ncbi:MAG: hypothetical protein JNL57_09110 [Bacteroidetes bacterium]|nr:hypothetical protein [Bacteroidota bacterium]